MKLHKSIIHRKEKFKDEDAAWDLIETRTEKKGLQKLSKSKRMAIIKCKAARKKETDIVKTKERKGCVITMKRREVFKLSILVAVVSHQSIFVSIKHQF